MKSRLPTLPILILALLLLPVVTRAQTPKDVIDFQLGLVGLGVALEGYETVVYSATYDKLNRGYYRSWNLDLKRGTQYGIVAACDGNCSDLDLALYDEENRLIMYDTKSDGLPTLKFAPRWTGRYFLRVAMEGCWRQPCSYGFAVLGR